MKNSVLTFAIFLSALSILITSCNKDEVGEPDQLGGSYKLTMDSKVISEGTSEEVGMIANSISISKGEDLSILLAAVPESVGGVVQLGGSNSQSAVSITGKNILLTDGSTELYFAVSGTIKRESATKITFEGICTEMNGGSTEHTFSGTMESDIFNII